MAFAKNSRGRTRPTVLQVLPSMVTGGVERGVIDVTAALVKAGFRALVASEGGPLVSHVLHRGGEHITLPLARKNPLTMLANRDKLADLIRREGVSIVHARSRAPAWSALWATEKTRVPFITTFHGIYGVQNAWKRRYNSVMVRGDRIIAISKFCADHMTANYNFDYTKLRLIHRGVDRIQFSPDRVSGARMAELMSRWRFPEGLPLILVPARLTRWKGQMVVVEALRQLPHRNFFCLFLGDDSGHETYRQELEHALTEAGLASHARIAPNTPHMPEAYALAHVVVAPSIEPEAFGRIAIEAQAMGRPIVAAAHGGALETVLPGETGWLAPPGDAEALARAIHEALALTEEQKAFIFDRAQAHVDEHFTVTRMCEATLAVYREVL